MQPTSPIPPKFITLGLLTLTVRVAQLLWVLRTKDRRFLISRAHGTVAYRSLELATLFRDEGEARTYMGSLQAGTEAEVEPVRLFDLIKDAMGGGTAQGPSSAIPPGTRLPPGIFGGDR